jgi:exopolyphosphatase/guanosine-5'-triphosphate,3'-diphosphate pyrophosphatase
MRTACIDIGSNTTRLLVAEVDETDPPTLREVTTQRVFMRLRGFEGAIPAEKVGEVAATVASQVRLARESGAEDVCAVATAAIRIASNRDELCAAVHEAAGVPVTVLSGDDEARLAFLGATRTLRHAPEGTVAVVDVGGGSTELVCGTLTEGVEWSASLRVGSGFLADHYVRSDPPSADELERIRGHVAGVFEALEAPRPGAAYAVGGSATSLRRLIGAVLDHETLGRAIRVVCEAPAEEVARRFDLHLERVRVLPAGMLLLDGASAFLEVPLQIACGGLREGVILERLAAQPE